MYVNGSARTHGALMFPKTTTCRVTVRFGATTTGEPVAAPPASAHQPPLPVFFNSSSPIPSWQLGPVYFFEDLPAKYVVDPRVRHYSFLYYFIYF